MHDLSELYQSVILDHNRKPRNFGKIAEANRMARGDNPSCGDNFTVYLQVEDGKIKNISFDGAGCAISKASASVMTAALKGQPAEEARRLFGDFHQLVTSGQIDPDEFTEMSAFAGVSAFPARIKCATLAWHAALSALEEQKEAVSTE
jgi:nitrogen fixation protein NifU and related proteins